MSQPSRPPDGVARRSQLLLGSGPGALLDLVQDAVIVQGLEAWRYRREDEGYLPEPRLQAKVTEELRRTPWWPGGEARLRLPPDSGGDEPSPAVGVGVTRFPQWFLCQGRDCRSLVELRQLTKRRGQLEHFCQHDKRTSAPVVPIRFVGACVRGHLQEIDWMWFVHRAREGEQHGARRDWCARRPGANTANDPLGEEWSAKLVMVQVGTSGELADYVLRCRACGKQRGLQDLGPRDALGRCQGKRPWLGYGADEGCDQPLKLLTRTASNAYFPAVLSALSIPDPSDALRAKVEEVWHIVSAATRETLPAFRTIPSVAAALQSFSDAEVLGEIQRRALNLPVAAPKLREAEWDALMKADFETPGVQPEPQQRWFAQRLDAELPDFIDRVVLVKHLTEVRAQLGFTRIEPISRDAEGEVSGDAQLAPLSRQAGWVPVVEILGEGVFIALNTARVDAWANTKDNSALALRERQFIEGVTRANEARRAPITFPGLGLVMLHTLSHMLINSISLTCGYAASSIRERLYWAVEPGPDGRQRTVRAGILLYTGSPGSEGSLGGLVAVGRDLVSHLKHAARMALLCSNDPVCAQHAPNDGQEGRHREGAACHGCVLIGEPSCERMNQDLDRTLVVPTVTGHAGAAFLGRWVETWR